MGRTTKSDVEQKIESLNKGWSEPAELTFECWGADGTNRYQLYDTDGNTYGSICMGATEFMKLLEGFGEGRRVVRE